MNNNNNIASPWKRLLSYLIDLGMYLLLPAVLVYELSTTTDLTTALSQASAYLVILIFIYPILWSLLDAYMISTFGGTWGKLATGTQITASDGGKISFWRAFFRNRIGYVISGIILWLGFIWILIDKERRAWHDMAADTLVVTKSAVFGFVGILTLAALVFVNYSLISSAVFNFRLNVNVYMDLFNTIKSSLLSH